MAGSQSERLDALWVALHTVAEASQEDLEFLMVCWTDEDLKCECAHVALRQSSGRYGRRTKAAVDAMTVGSSSSGGADPSTGPPNMQVKPVAKTKPGTDKEVSAQGPVVFYDTGDSYSKGHFFLYSTAGSQQGSQTAESSTAALAAAIAPAWTRVTMSDQWHGKMAMLRLGHWSSELAPQALEIPESIPLKETMTHDQPCDIKSRRISSISCFTIGGTSMVAGGMLPVQSAQPTADWPGPEEFLQLPPMPPVSRAVRTEIHVEVQAPKALSRSCRPKYAPVEKVVEAGCDLPVTLEGCSSAAPPFMVLRWLGRGGWGGNGLSANVVLYSKLISSLTAVDWKVTFGAAVTACGQPGWPSGLEILRDLSSKKVRSNQLITSSVITGSRHNWTLVLQLWSLLQRDATPDQFCLCSTISSLQATDQWRRAFFLLTKARVTLIELGVFCFNSAMSCAELSAWPSTLGLLAELQLRRLTNTVSYNCGITSLPDASHWQAAFGLCRHIREAGLWENEATYVLACGSCGPLWQSALAFVSTEKGTTRSLSSVLKACEMAAEWTQALRMLDSFDKYGISTTQVTINTAVSACQEHSVWPRALHLLCTCSQNEAADVVTWSATQAACRLQWTMATLLLTRMGDHAVRAGALSYDAAVASWTHGSHWHMAHILLRRMTSRRVTVLPATAYAGVRAAELANAQAPPWLLSLHAHS
ncbi:EMB2076 [Symbiodinium microadriaticum]|nr:EMB2076 [Symbiodinium microadriaticum]